MEVGWEGHRLRVWDALGNGAIPALWKQLQMHLKWHHVLSFPTSILRGLGKAEETIRAEGLVWVRKCG